MTDMKKPVYYYENTEGGHGVAANLKQRAYMWGYLCLFVENVEIIFGRVS